MDTTKSNKQYLYLNGRSVSMNEINLSTFYKHSSFMKNVHEGEKKIIESEKELGRLPKEESSIQIGDLIFSSKLPTV